ncbi:hypothetical protein ALI144C_03475 [Actinosynnema sp. ALI-1.44]|uniref:ImmA/IrrE family metallo-endopeptidase n=1 Tax=Actinosynnema sp. ALI-1.44 TaxID=1933779 RepID=UPI00097BCB41|nr:ImmA/IrrE family metallo-endopeptidase [Actinosynnema sp. ALI-1.44]ONI90096.1 hypothetical protein ALI144C_03475 [Actinosynnema sp. ALI-1.44]
MTTWSVAERLNWLFEVLVEWDADGWRHRTDAEAGQALADLGGQQAVELLRAGGTPIADQLAALGRFFGVDPAFFGDDPAEVDRIHDDVLAGALRDCGIHAYQICRVPLPLVILRKQLQTALIRERAAILVPRTWHDDPRIDGPIRDGGTTPMTVTPMSLAQLRALCRKLVDDLGMHPPFEAYEFCARLAEHRGRRIKVRATDLGATSGVGHLAPTADVDRIFVERDSPAPQQTLVIYHEVMHIVRDHLATGDTVTCGVGPAEDPEAGAYTDWREWEAEAGARELARLASQRPAPNRLTQAAGSVEHSIAAAFGFTHGR